MNFVKYSRLPDILTPEETRCLFQELLSASTQDGIEDVYSLARAIDEVADRHWHTYTLLDPITRSAIDEWVVRNWDRDSLRMTRTLIGIIGKLGLKKAACMLREEPRLDAANSVRKEIEDALREFGPNVCDPYSGMRKSSE